MAKTLATTTTSPSTLETPKESYYKVYHLASNVQLYAGVDLLGSKMSLQNRNSSLEVTELGVISTSKKNNRTVLIPFSNIKGIELLIENKET